MDTNFPNHGQSDEDRIEDLLRQDTYTPEEAAEVAGVPLRTVRSAAFRGDLKALILEHDIISIDRGDLIAWLQERG